MITWVIENKVFDENVERMVAEIQKQGFQHQIINRDLPKIDGCVVFYGSIGLSQKIRRETIWMVYCTLSKYDCAYYYPHFGESLLNEHYIMLPFGELQRRKTFLMNCLVNDRVFLRPTSGFKSFGGFVLSEKDWEFELHYLKPKVDPEKIVVAAPPKNIEYEWRLVVVDGKVIGGSQYVKDDEIVFGPCPKDVLEYGQSVIPTSYDPDPAWTLDICKTNGTLKVLEVGGFSTSGLYETDMEPVIREVSRVALRDYEDAYVQPRPD